MSFVDYRGERIYLDRLLERKFNQGLVIGMLMAIAISPIAYLAGMAYSERVDRPVWRAQALQEVGYEEVSVIVTQTTAAAVTTLVRIK